MKTLKNLVKLSSNVRVLIPSTFDINKTFDNAAQIDAALTLFSQKFGGATSFEALGAWQSPAAGLVKEKVTAVESYTNSIILENSINDILEFCEKLRDDLKQESIALFVNNELYLI